MITRHAVPIPARALRCLAALATAWPLSAPLASVAAPAVKDAPATQRVPRPQVQGRDGDPEAKQRQDDQNRQGRDGRGNARGNGRGDGRGGREDRGRRAREERSQGLRRMMSSMGFGDRALQDEVLSYIATESRERAQVRRKSQEMYNTLRDPNKSDADIRELLTQYQAAVEADRARHKEAEDALNERIDFRSKPRLEAMLTLFGVIGDAPGPTGGPR